MSFKQNIKNPIYWKHTLRLTLTFLVIVSLFSLFFNSVKDIISGNFDAVYQAHFANNLWMRFFLNKVVISLIYAMYSVNKKM